MMLELKDVTLCAVGSNDRLLAARALEISNSHCKFADSILFSHEPVQGSFRNVKIPLPKSMAEYNAFLLKELHKLVETPFVLVTQWDGYVIHPSAWREEFLQYDYIGATWAFRVDQMMVGNGGFSLRSKRLLQTVAQPWFQLLPGAAEDDLICRNYRPILEQQHQIRFAPPQLAEALCLRTRYTAIAHLRIPRHVQLLAQSIRQRSDSNAPAHAPLDA